MFLSVALERCQPPWPVLGLEPSSFRVGALPVSSCLEMCICLNISTFWNCSPVPPADQPLRTVDLAGSLLSGPVAASVLQGRDVISFRGLIGQ